MKLKRQVYPAAFFVPYSLPSPRGKGSGFKMSYSLVSGTTIESPPFLLMMTLKDVRKIPPYFSTIQDKGAVQ